jgi:hypothetical protein
MCAANNERAATVLWVLVQCLDCTGHTGSWRDSLPVTEEDQNNLGAKIRRIWQSSKYAHCWFLLNDEDINCSTVSNLLDDEALQI